MVPLASAFEGTVEGRTSGVSGAKVVAGDDAIDDGNPGKTMGKSESQRRARLVLSEQRTFPQDVETLVNVVGGLLSITFGLVTGGDFNKLQRTSLGLWEQESLG